MFTPPKLTELLRLCVQRTTVQQFADDCDVTTGPHARRSPEDDEEERSMFGRSTPVPICARLGALSSRWRATPSI